MAVTAWVFTMRRIHTIPREGRVAFFAGFGLTISTANIALVTITYGVISDLPEMVAGGLFFLTPIWASARHTEIYYAMVIGLCLGPIFHVVNPQLGLLFAGIIIGTLAFALERAVGAWRKRRHAD